ncbi:MAG TPA: carboxypeptidase-like regulatory domain-containing protein [Nitrospiria bacterium]|nr:carboxypeptidase-like regulatory domain-containing protein [Nitrospiria bacterium]
MKVTDASRWVVAGLLGLLVAGCHPGVGIRHTGAPGSGYKETAVPDGGTISGAILFSGHSPPPRLYQLNQFPQPDYCGRVDNDGNGNRVVRQVAVDNGRLADVVVAVTQVTHGKPFRFHAAEVTADGCRFLVRGNSAVVGVVNKDGQIHVVNMDADPADPQLAMGVLHNPHGYEINGKYLDTLFNQALPRKGQEMTEMVRLRRQGTVVKLECDQHNYMTAYFYPVDNPYFAVVGPSGTFVIDQLPPGTYQIHAWHPILGEQVQTVTVTARRASTIDFTFTAK